MSTDDKLVWRVLEKHPVPNDITPNELRRLASIMGWSIRKGRGSHISIGIITRDGGRQSFTVPIGGRKTILPWYISEIRKIAEGE